MKIKVILVLLVLSVGYKYVSQYYKDQQIKKRNQEIFQKDLARSRERARDIEGATISVNAAYRYQGPAIIQPTAGNKFIAIDLSVRGAGKMLDVGAIGLQDGSRKEFFGHVPDRAWLDPDTGAILPDQQNYPPALDNVRCLLIYDVPEALQNIQLNYWSGKMTSQSLTLSENPPSGQPVPREGQLSSTSDVAGKRIRYIKLDANDNLMN